MNMKEILILTNENLLYFMKNLFKDTLKAFNDFKNKQQKRMK